MTTEHAPVEPALVEARRLLERVEHDLTAARPAPHALRSVVEGTHQLTTALSDLVATLINQAPTALAATNGHDGHLAREVVADLRAMRGCLTTGALLLAPALDDLRGLTRPGGATASERACERINEYSVRVAPPSLRGCAMSDVPLHQTKPDGDLADQARPAWADEDTDHDELPHVHHDGAVPVVEANPVDVADQHVIVRPADLEPWP